MFLSFSRPIPYQISVERGKLAKSGKGHVFAAVHKKAMSEHLQAKAHFHFKDQSYRP